MTENRNGIKPPWNIRRRIIFTALFFCAGLVLACAFGFVEVELAKVIIPNCFVMALGVIGSYVFGATWDDKR